jgi:branched-chain amino acid transport system ATP-binding protein
MVRSTGDLMYDGKRINNLPTEAIAAMRVGHVPDGRGTFMELSVEENLRLGGYTRKDSIEPDLERMFTYFPKLKDRFRQQAGTLSGGEQQMLAVARALMSRPRLLLMDEPSVGLAPLVVAEIFAIIRQLHAEGVSLFVVEQNAHMALKVAQHFYLMEQGRVSFSGSPGELADDDVYYNRVSASGTTNTRGLRDFHNLVVKRALIGGASRRGNTLIDFAVGKGGDLPKWIHANLSFVFGIDISKDNIQNQLDGACARYLDYCKRFSIMPGALFVQGNSALNIKSGAGISGEKYKQIVKAVFGDGPKDKALLGEGVYREYGKAENGFNVSSCQFAIHYMFETRANVCNFLRNVCECTEVGGYFIGTTYDGATMFEELHRGHVEEECER